MTETIRIEEEISPELLEKLADILNSNGVIIAPTDTVYGLITKAFDENAFNRLETIKGKRVLPYVTVFSSYQHLEEMTGVLNPFQRRIADALLPGPVTLILDANPAIPPGFRYAELGIGVRIMVSDILTRLSDIIKSPLWATSANRSGTEAPVSFSEIDTDLFEEVNIVMDRGATFYVQPSTIIDLRKMPFRITRKGSGYLKAKNTLEAAQFPLEILIVCTGNICRSPFAEVVLKDYFEDPEQSGVNITSAGTHTVNGLPATDKMIEIAGEWGIDHTEHEARQLTDEILISADLILTAEPYHREWIIERIPQIADRIKPLAETINQDSIPDPYGEGMEEYRRSAATIRQVVMGWKTRIEQMIHEAGWKPASIKSNE